MKNIIYCLILVNLFFACEQYPMPGSETLEVFNYMILGDNQSAESGNYLQNEVGVQIMLESLVPPPTQKFHIELQVTEGGGTLDKTTIEADNAGKMLTRWKLGDEQNQQTVKGKIFDASGKYYSEFTINANAFFPDKWNTFTTGYLIGIGDMVTDTVNNRSMMISGMDLYKKEGLKVKFYEWEQIQGYSYHYNFKELEINSKGEVFGGGWDGNLYKSTDWGQNWILISKPIPGNIYHFELSVTKEDFIWANKWDYGVYCSKDNGLTWTKDSTGLENQEQLGRVFSFIGNSHLALSHNKLVILQTFDNGKTWGPIPTPEYSLTIFVTDENEIIAQNQGGFNLHKSSDSGKTYKKVFSPNVAYGTTSWHCYDKFKDYYYVLAPGGGVWKTRDFEKFEELVTFSLQRNLFIDHQGTIYASGFNYSNAKDDPTLVLPYND
jgi:photosystem II stability/assembly factor-like uncharacterized protein